MGQTVWDHAQLSFQEAIFSYGVLSSLSLLFKDPWIGHQHLGHITVLLHDSLSISKGREG